MTRFWRVLAPVVAVTALLLAEPAPAPAAAAAWPTCDGAVWAPINAGPGQAKRFLPTHHTLNANCQLKLNDFNNWGVVALQEVLIDCYGQSITRDADFGPRTEDALKTAQLWEQYVNHKPIGVTGVYNPATRDAIMWPTYVNGVRTGCRYW